MTDRVQCKDCYWFEADAGENGECYYGADTFPTLPDARCHHHSELPMNKPLWTWVDKEDPAALNEIQALRADNHRLAMHNETQRQTIITAGEHLAEKGAEINLLRANDARQHDALTPKELGALNMPRDTAGDGMGDPKCTHSWIGDKDRPERVWCSKCRLVKS